MDPRSQQAAVLGGVFAVVIALAFFMAHGSFELWGGVMLIPVLAAINLPLVALFLRRRHPGLVGIVMAGFFLKMVGSLLRFYVFSSVYGSVADATYYYNNGSRLAAAVRSGQASWTTVLPLARELFFVIRLTGLVLTFTGPTRLGAFLVFSVMGFWGAVFLAVAGCRAIPGLSQRRYAWLCMVTPTIVFWPSSIGKEAWMLLCIGGFSFGIAKLLTRDRPAAGVILMALAVLGIGAVRLHLAALFLMGASVAILQRAILPPTGRSTRRPVLAVFLGIGTLGGTVAAGLAFVRQVSTKNGGDILAVVSDAVGRVNSLSGIGGSAFTPINIRNPLNWPYGIVRTLTRPLLIDVNSIPALAPALEVTAFLLALVVGYRRLGAFRSQLRNSPYLTYAVITTLLFGLIFSAIGNLGILVRQRSLVAAFMLILVCLPKAPSRRERIDRRISEAEAQRGAGRGAAASRA